MLQFDFRVPSADSLLRKSWPVGNHDSFSATELHYKLFYAHVDFSANGVQFISPEGFVTLVDIALGAMHVAKRLSQDSDGALGFTEDDEVIRFRCSDDDVVVSSSKKDEAATIERSEVIRAFRLFAKNAHDSVVAHRPTLSENELVRRLLQV